jgi:hypothetical protein
MMALVPSAAVAHPSAAVAQHEAHHESGQQAPAELLQCARVQPVVDNIIAGAMDRIESARLSNNPSEMRAAVDQLGASLRDIRARLAPCSAAVATTDPHTGHIMPRHQPAAGAAAPATPMPAGGTGSHAGHEMPTASPAPIAPLPEQAGRLAANPHAAHPSGQKAATAEAAQAGADEATALKAWLKEYDAAFNAKDLDKLETFYDPDVTIYEGGGVRVLDQGEDGRSSG